MQRTHALKGNMPIIPTEPLVNIKTRKKVDKENTEGTSRFSKILHITGGLKFEG
jgi:hypothetical protein